MLAKCRSLDLRRRLEADGRQEGDGDPGKPAQADLAAKAREGAELGAVDAHRQDRGSGHLGDGGGPFIDLHQGAGDGQAPLGEDHHFAAAAQLGHQAAERHRVRRIDRDHVEEHEGRPRPPAH